MDLVVLCTVEAGLDSISVVLSSGHKIKAIISLNPADKDLSLISGLVDVKAFAEKWEIPHFYVSSYSLSSIEDKRLLLSLEYDILWVSGWQRLLPKWAIEHAKIGAIGGHGSPDGVRQGRGRSPQNWSLLLGCNDFHVSLFLLRPGIDDGDILDTATFKYNPQDDIKISYKKNSLCIGRMMSNLLSNPDFINKAVPQSGEAQYFPQRLPEDGLIDWNLPGQIISRLCRALTKPYPGMFAMFDNIQVSIWRCQYFDNGKYQPGSIFHVFNDGQFLVGCGDGLMLVEDFSANSHWVPEVGFCFQSGNFKSQIKEIVRRHNDKHPELMINTRVLNLLR
ncbi:hypothetical protein LSUCC0246_09935 [Rhodobacterales bacterium LSUCC0246]|nr:hypothetical protein [Rhodobacterales bacterium LSUCC0374]